MESHISHPTFLQNASHDQLETAVAGNHHAYMTTKTRAGGGELHEENGVTWTFTPGRASEGMILFPRFSETDCDLQIDRIIQFYLNRKPAKLVGCWSLDPTQPRDLGVRLLARGFQPGWRPRWMWLDLQKMKHEHPRPGGLRIAAVETATDWDVKNLPYYDPEIEATLDAVVALRPQRVWHFAAWLDGKPVGHSVVCLTTGDRGIAGIYEVGVVPEARNRGIGKAVTIAACAHDRDMGCYHAMLNGTGERMYRQLGFERIGYGFTWWLNVSKLLSHLPSPWRIAFAEAIGREDLEALEQLARRNSENLDAPLANGMTPVELAGALRNNSSAKWLVDHGAALDVLVAWDLGWKDRAAALLARNPDLANKRSGERQMTPLHAAAERGDAELARLLLTAKPDMEIKDGMVGGTALGWARHFQRAEVIELFEKFSAGKAAS